MGAVRVKRSELLDEREGMMPELHLDDTIKNIGPICAGTLAIIRCSYNKVAYSLRKPTIRPLRVFRRGCTINGITASTSIRNYKKQSTQ